MPLVSPRAISLTALGREEDAVASYDKALEIEPRSAATWFNRGNSLDALGRSVEAAESYRRFIDLATPDLSYLVEEARRRIADLSQRR